MALEGVSGATPNVQAEDAATKQNNQPPPPAPKPDPQPQPAPQGDSVEAFQAKNGVSNDFTKNVFTAKMDDPAATTTGDSVGAERKPLSGPTTTYVKGAGDANAVDLNDIKQGQLNDCYVMSGTGAIARQDPNAIQNAIRENKDDKGNVTSYTVTLYQKRTGISGFFQGGYEKKEYTVDATFPNGGKHAGPGDTDAKGNQEIWPLVIEKAYGQSKGGYDAINQGGNAGDVMTALTGRDTQHISPGNYSFEQMQKDLKAGSVTAGTPDDKTVAKKGPLGFGLHSWHSYVVTGTYTDKDGKQMVQLYNPWGSDHPKPMPFEEFKKNFNSVQVNK
jgi:hypothetical protein